MSNTIQVSFHDALIIVKKSLEIGKVQNAIQLLDNLISQLAAIDVSRTIVTNDVQSTSLICQAMETKCPTDVHDAETPSTKQQETV